MVDMVDKRGKILILTSMPTPREQSRLSTSSLAPRRKEAAKPRNPETKVSSKKPTGTFEFKSARKGPSKSVSKPGIARKAISTEIERTAAAYLFGTGPAKEAKAKALALIVGKRVSRPGLGRAADRLDRMAKILRELAHQSVGESRSRAAAKAPENDSKADSIAAAVNEASKDGPRKLIEQGAFIPAGQLCERLNITRQALSKAKNDKRMFAIIGPSGDAYYPTFFADAKHDRRQLEKVSRALQDLPATSKYFFFTAPRESLGRKSPLDAIANGQIEAVLRSASGFVER